MTTPADHNFHFDPNDDPCPSCDTQMAGESNCPNCMLEHPDRYYDVNDEMIERAWAAIVGFDVARQCFTASLTRADLRTGIVAALAFANGKSSVGAQAEGVATVNSRKENEIAMLMADNIRLRRSEVSIDLMRRVWLNLYFNEKDAGDTFQQTLSEVVDWLAARNALPDLSTLPPADGGGQS